ncbi:hypothetical protein ACH5RR_015250 [Cinchona calisaya]|uniref:Reverse transcriptase zinc-binding domain-containing protein n=1 Tax=Cinchona calisaya TaxID=153742 RepID=A0ABD2ZUD5_9GENT
MFQKHSGVYLNRLKDYLPFFFTALWIHQFNKDLSATTELHDPPLLRSHSLLLSFVAFDSSKMEDTDHLLLHCGLAHECWRLVLPVWIPLINAKKGLDILFCWRRQAKYEDMKKDWEFAALAVFCVNMV